MMARCIELDRDCADLCALAVRLMSRGSDFAARLCAVCAEVCEACACECTKHDADFDQSFLQMMSQHHHAAVEMSEQAESKSTHPELKEFTSKMAKDQESEIKQMKNWAQSWFGPA